MFPMYHYRVATHVEYLGSLLTWKTWGMLHILREKW